MHKKNTSKDFDKRDNNNNNNNNINNNNNNNNNKVNNSDNNNLIYEFPLKEGELMIITYTLTSFFSFIFPVKKKKIVPVRPHSKLYPHQSCSTQDT